MQGIGSMVDFFAFYFKIWVLCSKSIIYFKLDKKNTPFYAVGWKLFKKEMALPKKAERDLLILFRVLKHLTLKLFINKKKEISTGSIALIVGSKGEESIRLEYLNYFKKLDRNNYCLININNLIFKENIILSVLLLSVTVLISFIIFFLSLFSKYKYTLPLLLSDVILITNLLLILKKQKVKSVILFNIYNRWSNLLGLVLKKQSIKLTMVPSEVPLMFWNSHLVTEKLVFCHPYQKDEVKFFSKSMYFQSTELLGPERIHEIADFYLNHPPTHKKSIGFYSSGMWFRKKRGDIEAVEKEFKNEDILAGWVKEFAMNQKEIELQVYLHPNELKPENISDAKEHWNKIFSGPNITYMNENTPSNLQFHKTKVGVSLYSTVMFERDYLGFKTIIVPLGTKDFPIKNSSLALKSCKTKGELLEMLDTAINH